MGSSHPVVGLQAEPQRKGRSPPGVGTIASGHPAPIRQAGQANRDVGQASHALLHRQQAAVARTGSQHLGEVLGSAVG